jgi:hypothetical protein
MMDKVKNLAIMEIHCNVHNSPPLVPVLRQTVAYKIYSVTPWSIALKSYQFLS